MHEDVRLVAAEFPYGRHGGVQDAARQAVRQLRRVRVELFLPGVRAVA